MDWIDRVMFSLRLRALRVGIFAGLALATEAGAAESSTTDASTTDASTTDASTSGTSSSGTSGADASGDAGCGDQCTVDAGMIRFAAPLDGATVASTFIVTLASDPECACDTCGCWDQPPQRIDLYLDDQPVDGDCEQAITCKFSVDASPGAHTLRAAADGSGLTGATIAVTVEAPATGSEGGPGMSDEWPDANPEGDGATPSGCGCATARSGMPSWLWLSALALVWRPRRHHRPRPR